MTVYLIDHFFKNPQREADFRLFREKRLNLVGKHAGTVLSAFQPAGRDSTTVPDEIHIVEFPSENAYAAYLSDPAQTSLAALEDLAVTTARSYRSGIIIPQESMLATVLTRKPVELSSPPDQTKLIADNLTRSFSPLQPGDLHPAQKQVELDTVILHPQNETQKKLSNLVQKWQSQRDRRVIFAHTYYLMTGNMLSALHEGQFHDRVWVTRLLDKFAEYYFKALEKFEHLPFTAPPIWRVAFQVAENENSYVAQHLLLGVNAHINYDLVSTLIEVMKDEWKTLSPAQKRQRYEDHTHVNRIIETTFDETQQLVIARYSPTLDKLSQVSFNLDNLVISSLIRSWREQAWIHAIDYLEAGNRDRRLAVLQETEYIALRRADMIMLKQGPIKMTGLS